MELFMELSSTRPAPGQLRQDAPLHDGMRKLSGLSNQAQAMERLYEISEDLREKLPARSGRPQS